MPDSSIPDNTFANQPTLWDNIALENAYQCLSELRLDEAISQFKEAMDRPCDRNDVVDAMETARYWQLRIKEAKPTQTVHLIEDYKTFSFDPLLKKFRSSLLFFIVDNLYEQKDLDGNLVESAFDLLLEIKSREKAESFIINCMSRFPQNYEWLFLKAQSQWRRRKKIEAATNYVSALLHVSMKIPSERIESKEIKNLISQYGAAMAPAYAWIKGIAPFVSCDIETDSEDPIHDNALKSYHFLQQAHYWLEKNDLKKAIQYRKQLKALNPQLYGDYYIKLKQQA